MKDSCLPALRQSEVDVKYFNTLTFSAWGANTEIASVCI